MSGSWSESASRNTEALKRRTIRNPCHHNGGNLCHHSAVNSKSYRDLRVLEKICHDSDGAAICATAEVKGAMAE